MNIFVQTTPWKSENFMSVKKLIISAFTIILSLPVASHAQQSPSPYTTGYRYDAMHRLTGVINPAANSDGSSIYFASRNTYDSSGRLIRTEKGELSAWQGDAISPAQWVGFTPVQTVTTTYDSMSRKASEATSNGGITYSLIQYNYDIVGRLQCSAVRMNKASLAYPSSSACVLGAAGSDGPDRIQKNIYDAAGQLIQIRKAVGTPLEEAYVTYSYTANGKQDNLIDANGNRAKFSYDGFDRKTYWYFPSKTRTTSYNFTTQATALSSASAYSTTDYEQYGYDKVGNRTSLRKRDGQIINYGYDPLNRLIFKDIPGGTTKDVYYGYDFRGLQIYARYEYVLGQGISNSYDGAGRLIQSTNSLNSATRKLSYEYDKNGNRTRLTFPDGVNFVFSFDKLDRLVTVNENGISNVLNISYNNRGERVGILGAMSTTYAYDGISRLSSVSHDVAGTSYDVTFCLGSLSGSCNAEYNAASQALIRTISNNSYVYSQNSNLNQTYVTNGLNQYASIDSTSLSYDANGNLTWGGANSYSYDVENRLIGVTGSTSTTLSYDPLGRLNQTATSGAAVNFLYDGDALVAEYDNAGNLLKRYIHGAETDEPLLWYEGSTLGNRRDIRADHEGSIVSISDSAGYSIGINRYDEWGVPQSLNLGRFQYTGQILIPEIGLYHYKARAYSPKLGRFMQVDPTGYDDQANLYTYVNDDPLNKTDPTGKIAETPWDVLNVGLDVASLTANVASGNMVGAAVDGVALLYDGAAALVPGLPGGAGAGLKVLRGADKVAEASRSLEKTEVAVKRIHGNSLDSPKPAKGYSLRDRDSGKVLKYGETTRGEKRYSQKYMEKNNAQMRVEAEGTKREMHTWQHNKIMEHKEMNDGARPPLNKSNW